MAKEKRLPCPVAADAGTATSVDKGSTTSQHGRNRRCIMSRRCWACGGQRACKCAGEDRRAEEEWRGRWLVGRWAGGPTKEAARATKDGTGERRETAALVVGLGAAGDGDGGW